ncbi:MAG TPA: PAS domain S-box protein, partial [Gammaproteobacteria bacterium]|nr:PAS domain S-box protein [Gammaproteobacteria bacterium]
MAVNGASCSTACQAIMTLRGKLLAGFSMMLLLLLVQGIFSGLLFRESRDLGDSVAQKELPLVLEVLELRELLYQTEGALNGWVLSEEVIYKQQYDTLWLKILEKIRLLEVADLDLKVLILQRLQKQALELAHSLEGQPAKQMLKQQLKPGFEVMMDAARRLLFYERRRAQGDEEIERVKQSKFLMYLLSTFQRSLSESMAVLNTVLVSGETEGEGRFIRHWQENEGAWISLNRAELTSMQQQEMDRVRAVREQFKKDALWMIQLRMDLRWNLATWKVSQEVTPVFNQVIKQVDQLVDERTARMDSGFINHAEMMEKGGQIVWLFLVVALLTVVITARALINRIHRPIQRVQQVFKEIMDKNYHTPIQVESNDEMGVLLTSLKEMRRQLMDAEIAEQAAQSVLLNQKFALDQSAVVSATDLDGVINYVNQGMLDLMGYSKEEMVGSSHSILKSGVHDDTFYREMWETIASGLVWKGEVCDRARDGRMIWTDTTVVPFLGEEMMPVQYMAIRHDITLIKESEQRIREEQERTIEANQELQHSMQQLKEAQQKLVESEKMASLGGLVAGIAHEVNTPLGISVTAASYLKDKTNHLSGQYQKQQMKRSDLMQYLQSAEESTSIVLENLTRASDLVKSFKQVAVDQSSDERRLFYVISYLHDILRSLHPQLKKLPHQTVIEGDESIEVMNDPGAFAQVVTNLVMNSIIHGFEDSTPGVIRIVVSEEGESVVIVYQDNGQGASPEVVGKIFEPFFTTRRGDGGSGLGMHLVYNLVTQRLGG